MQAVAGARGGKLIVGGTITAGTAGSGPLCRGAFVGRLNADGSLDRSFSNNGWTAFSFAENSTAFFSQVRVLPDGRILLGGLTPGAGLVNDVLLVRLMPQGALDPTFSGDGILTTHVPPSGAAVFDLVLDAQGRAVVAGA